MVSILIILITSNTAGTWLLAMFLGSDKGIFVRASQTSQTLWRLPIREGASWLAISLFSQFCCIDKLEEVHEDTASYPKLDETDFFFSDTAHTQYEHFWTWVVSSTNLHPITGIRVMISRMAFDRSDRLSWLKMFPYDQFKFYMIIPIILKNIPVLQATDRTQQRR